MNQAVFFNASTSTASTGHTITTYAWDFGDGSSGSGRPAVTHTSSTGTFTVTLTATDDIGQKGTLATPVIVATVGTGSLIANFSFSPTDPVSGQLVSFNASLSSPISTIVSYDWDFGDGVQILNQPSFLINHTYFTSTGNTFEVKLTVHDNTVPSRSAIVAIKFLVKAGGDPTAAFTISPSPANVGVCPGANCLVTL